MTYLSNVDVVIVNWNAGEMLSQCVQSVQKAWRGSSEGGRVVVVDNSSTDGSLKPVESLKDLPFELVVIRNNENYGFAAACNQGALLANSEYLLFLNPDARLFEDSLSVSLRFMQQHGNKNVGIIGLQLVDEHNRVAQSCSRFPTLKILVAQAMGLNRLPLFHHLTQGMAEWSHDSTRQVDQVIGACFLIRRSLFLTLGGFDERFFVYFEEVDLSLRAHQAGRCSVYLVEAKAFHAGGGTSRQVKAHRLFYSLRSRLLYGFKHFRRWQAWVLLGVTLVLEPITRSIFSLMRGGVGDLRNTLKAYGMLFRDLCSILNVVRENSER